uniref:DOMON domain-containing protein n=1 Tax=Sexangularia sp. CB-2014 TaxID=1486929 RepID=A0A7S1YDW0_9EUKA
MYLAILWAVCPAQSLDHSASLTESFNLSWSILGRGSPSASITVGFTVRDAGWFGFGIGEPTSGSMAGADMLIVQVDRVAGRVTLSDRFADGFVLPSVDNCADWSVVTATIDDDEVYVEATRLLDTGDSQDRVIRLGEPERVLYAWGSSTEVQYHGSSNRGLDMIDFGGSWVDRIAQLRDDPTVVAIELRNEYTITDRETVYHTARFDPFDDGLLEPGVTYHIVATEHIVQEDTLANVHHFVSSLVPGNVSGGNGREVYPSTFHTWASGSSPMVTPDACGYRLGEDGYSSLEMETHYDNARKVNVGTVDRSGIRVYLTKDLRPHDCGVLSLGDPAIMLEYIEPTLPAGLLQSEFSCPSWCVPYNVTIFSSFLHMHDVGKRMWTDHVRNGETIGRIDQVDFWDEGMQSYQAVSVDVQAGDAFRTTCIHNSNGDVRWGIASSDEMCIHFLSYYPHHADFEYCGLYVCGEQSGNATLDNDVPAFGVATPGRTCPDATLTFTVPDGDAPTTDSAEGPFYPLSAAASQQSTLVPLAALSVLIRAY